MAPTTKIFKSDPIWHINGKFRINLIQFKSSLRQLSVAVKQDFMRVARTLCNDSEGEILAVPRSMPFQAKSQYQAQHGQIIMITSQFCDWQYVLSCLEKNGMELSNDDYNSEMNSLLLRNALNCENISCFYPQQTQISVSANKSACIYEYKRGQTETMFYVD